MKKRINELMDMFPYFFNKEETSNFFKSQSVTNNQLLKIYESLMILKDSLRLDKNCLIWKEQEQPYDYTINFLVNYPCLKSVKCYKNDTLIYMEEYLEEDKINSFLYSYNSDEDNNISLEDVEDNEEEIQEEDIPIIPEDTFHIIAESYDEIIITKGFPENDTLLGNMYDHNISLDEIGALNNIPRKTYKETDDYANTEPTYNNRLTEDDYHYMNRIIEYNLRLHNTSLPVLEIWKLYGIFADMVNREEYLLKMFDERMHPYDEETGLVGEWTPQPWEHKDKLCDLTPDLGRFFFVSANTLLPVKNQSVIFNFRYLNMLAETLPGDYNVTITLLGEEDTVIVENYTGGQYTVSNELLSDDEPNVFKFEAFEGMDIFATEEVTVNVRGCNTADWYVNPLTGDDTNDGETINTPFQTINKALSVVDGERNLIVLTSGTYTITSPLNVQTSSTVLGCGNAIIENTTSYKFFRVYQNQRLNLQDLSLTHDTSSERVDNTNWINNNKNNNPIYVVISEGAGKTLTLLSMDTDKLTYTIGETIEITGLLTDDEETALAGKSIKIYVNNELVDTVTTENNTGNFSKNITATTSGNLEIRAVFDGDEDYRSNSASEYVTVNKKTSTITLAANKASYVIGETISLTGTLSSGATNIASASVKIYDGETLLDTVTTDNSGAFTKTVSAVALGSKTYKAVYEGSSTYDSVTSSDVTLTITKRTPTISLVTSSAAVTVGGSYTLSGALLYDNSGVGSASIKIYNGATLVDTVTTSNDGTFSKSFTNAASGTYSYKALFEGNGTYNDVESSVVNVIVSDAPAPASISLSCDKPIMMTGETATITATVLDENDNPCVGETVSFEVVDGEDLGTATTDSSGEASVYYLGIGAGDLNIKAECSLLIQTCSIEDCVLYNSNTYSSNATFNYNLPTHFKIEYESLITQTTNNSCFIRVGESDTRALLTGKVGSGDSMWKVTVRTSSSGTGDIPNTGGAISLSSNWQSNTITWDGTSYKFHDITVTNRNGVSLSKLVSFATWKSGTTSGQIRNIKIKPL